MHSSKKVDVLLVITSNPIIEHCQEIRFGRYPNNLLPVARREEVQVHSPIFVYMPSRYSYQNLGAFNVQDFSHIRPTPSPNFSAMTNEEMDVVGDKLSGSYGAFDLQTRISSIVPVG